MELRPGHNKTNWFLSALAREVVSDPNNSRLITRLEGVSIRFGAGGRLRPLDREWTERFESVSIRFGAGGRFRPAMVMPVERVVSFLSALAREVVSDVVDGWPIAVFFVTFLSALAREVVSDSDDCTKLKDFQFLSALAREVVSDPTPRSGGSRSSRVSIRFGAGGRFRHAKYVSYGHDLRFLSALAREVVSDLSNSFK